MKRYRGGFCLEVNLLLNWLLQELGFQTTILGGEVKDKGTQKFPGPRNQHLIIQVRICSCQEGGTALKIDNGNVDNDNKQPIGLDVEMKIIKLVIIIYHHV